jgi:hypothetical protein
VGLLGPVDPAWIPSPAQTVFIDDNVVVDPPWLDLLVVPSHLRRWDPSLLAAADAARNAGARVATWPADDRHPYPGTVDVVIGPPLLRPLTTTSLLVLPERGAVIAGAAGDIRVSGGTARRLQAQVQAANPGAELRVVALPWTGPPGTTGGGLAYQEPPPFWSLTALIDSPELHSTPWDRAATVVAATAMGVPVVAIDPFPGLVAEGLADQASLEVLSDLDRRDRAGAFQQRLTLQWNSPWRWWEQVLTKAGITPPPLPKVTVMLVTKRPGFLDHVLDQVAKQTYPELELVAVLHGEEWSADHVATIESRWEAPVVVRAPGTVTFGEAFNIATRHATGELVTKFDDDDWYDRDHIWDVALALETTGYELVGKTAEWIYLEELDATIRRARQGGGNLSPMVAGGTITMRKDDLLHAGGWRRAPRHIDQGLIADVRALGGRTYRTHGFGYVLNRHGTAHTWSVETDRLLQQADSQYRGLALEAAGVSAG